VLYEVDPDLSGVDVILWWGLFDQELYVEHGDKRFGPFNPIGGPIPLHKYRKYQKSRADERADRIAALADKIGLPRSVMEGGALPPLPIVMSPAKVAFVDPDPPQTIAWPTVIAAKLAIADDIGMALAKLSPEDRAFIDALLRESLVKKAVLPKMRERLAANAGKGS